MTTVTILQSNYIPWKGYFDIIAAADVHVVYDVVQYTKNDWRNRNRIKKRGGGSRWLTVPVHQRTLDQRIDETMIAERDVLRSHWNLLEQTYEDARCFDDMAGLLHPLFDRRAPELLHDLNVDLLQQLCAMLGIDTTIRQSTQFDLGDDRNRRLVDICEQIDADTYLSGPAARDYLDVDAFTHAGIDVTWMDYEGYPEYDQPHPPFDHRVSIIDTLLCSGDRAADQLLRASTSA